MAILILDVITLCRWCLIFWTVFGDIGQNTFTIHIIPSPAANSLSKWGKIAEIIILVLMLRHFFWDLLLVAFGPYCEIFSLFFIPILSMFTFCNNFSLPKRLEAILSSSFIINKLRVAPSNAWTSLFYVTLFCVKSLWPNFWIRIRLCAISCYSNKHCWFYSMVSLYCLFF